MSDADVKMPEALVVVRDTDEEPENGGWIVDCDCEGPLTYSLQAGDDLYTADQLRAAVLADRERWQEEIDAAEERYHLLAAELVYNGTSVQHWYSKAKAYGDAIMKCWDVLKQAGRPPDGKTPLNEAIAAAIRKGTP